MILIGSVVIGGIGSSTNHNWLKWVPKCTAFLPFQAGTRVPRRTNFELEKMLDVHTRISHSEYRKRVGGAEIDF